MKLKDRVAILTGGSRGIGKAYANALAAEGVRLCIADILDKEGSQVAKEIEDKGGKAFFIHTDVSKENDFQETAKQAAQTYGGIDILVNNAALFRSREPWDPLVGPLASWDRLWSINVTSVLIGIRSVVPYMKQRGGGSIINQSSITSYFMGGDYGTSKLAVLGLTIGFAQLLGPSNIRVNAIAPGLIPSTSYVDNEANRRSAERAVASQAIKKEGAPEDLCGALIFLASDDSKWVTGETINVDGGWVRRI